MAATKKNVSMATGMATKGTREDPQALDGGWAWIIVLGVGLSFSISVGFSKSFTLIYQELLLIFGQSDFATSWVAALFGSMKMFTGPVVSALCNMYGHRRVTIAGGILTSIGGIISAFAPSLPFLYVSHGIIGGLGSNLMITPSYSIICQYFDTKRGVATALATSSLAVGGAIFAPLITWLLDGYGYTGTMLISGAIFLHFCVSGSLYRPLEDNFPKQKPTGKEAEEILSDPLLCDTEKDCKTDRDYDETEEDVHLTKMHRHIKHTDKCSMMGSLRNLQLEGCESMMDIHKAHTKEDKMKMANSGKDGANDSLRNSTIQEKFHVFFHSLHLQLFKNLTFTLFCFYMSSLFFSFFMNITFLSGVTRERGFNARDTAVLLIIINCFDCPARLISGPLFDWSLVKKHMIFFHVGLSMLSSLCLLLLHFCGGGLELYICWVAFQIFASMSHSQHTNVLAILVPSSQLTSGVGLMRFVQGIGMIASPTLGGYIKDVTGRYSYGYLVGGCVPIFFSIIFTTYYVLWGSTSCRMQSSETCEQDNEHTV